jgi:dTDP-4-amino-4,6-dideoxygalactose transaminase
VGSDFVVPYIGKGSWFGSAELEVLHGLLTSDVHLGVGEQVPQFEAEMAQYLGVRNAIAVSSCSMALELVTRVLGLGPGDEVITSPLTYEASIWSMQGHECTVAFCDVDPETLCLTARGLEAEITERTKAILVTHYGGVMADMDELRAICDRHGLALIEDCAHAVGATYRGRAAGAIGDFGCFSFQSLKHISTLGQGGLITVTDNENAERLRTLRSGKPDAVFVPRVDAVPFTQAGDPGRIAGADTHEKNAYTHDCERIRAGGLNTMLGEPAAAVGRVQLGRVPDLLAARRTAGNALDERLAAIPGIHVPQIPPDREHARWLYAFLVEPEAKITRNELVEGLNDAGIEIILRFFPLHLLPEWRDRPGTRAACPTVERVWFRQLVNLPFYPHLTAEQIDYMCATVSKLMS